MRNLSVWIVLTLIASAGALAEIHYKSLQEGDRKVVRLTPLYERQDAIARMTLELERYRRLSGSFRKESTAEINAVKDKLRKEIGGGIARLDKLDPTQDDRTHALQLGTQLNDLLEKSAKIEPTLFLRDAYFRPEIQELHEQMIQNLVHLDRTAKTRAAQMTSGFQDSPMRSTELLLAVASLMVALTLVLILRNYIRFGRPLAKLRKYARELRTASQLPSGPGLTRIFGEIEIALHELAARVESHRNERHKFIQDVVSDLRAPLTMLQAGKALLAQPGSTPQDERAQVEAAASVRRGISLLSGSLDDLLDVTEIGRLEGRLEESVVDLPELISDVARNLSGAGLGRQVTTSLPPMPVWMRVDDRRIARVLVQLLLKMAAIEGATPSNKIHVAVTAPKTGQGGAGLVITISDADRATPGPARARAAAGGPEQDLPRHWVSEQGFSMALAHKIVKAHGGSVSAAGVVGMSLQFTIRLPSERLSTGLLAPTDQPLRSIDGDIEGAGLLAPPKGAMGEVRRFSSTSMTDASGSDRRS